MWPSCYILVFILLPKLKADDDDYNLLHRDGSYEFGYKTPDSYHYADANRNNVVRGEFGGRNPGTGAIDTTVYTAGPRGYRPRGKNIHRKYDLNQNGPRPIGSRDDPYYDPFEDPSYSFAFRTRTYNRQENANRVGDVTGKYSYTDDVGERHNVEYIAGKNTGFHVKTPFPDSNPRAYGPLYFRGRGRPIPRGRTSIQRGLDGSYRFVSAGPDQRRTETSDASGHVRGSYTYLDDKGVQHSVHYIAGPETGYKVLKNVKGPHLPTIFPFGSPDIIPPDFYDYVKDTGDVFGDQTGTGKPSVGGGGGSGISGGGSDGGGGAGGIGAGGGTGYDDDGGSDDFSDDLFGGSGSSKPGGVTGGGGGGSRPIGGGGGGRPGDGIGGDVGGGHGGRPGGGIGGGGGSTGRPGAVGGGDDSDDGSYKPSDGDDGQYRPSPGESGELPRPIINLPSRPRPGSSDFDGNNNVDGDVFGSFGDDKSYGGANTGGSTSIAGGGGGGGGGRPNIQITGADSGCERCKGTIVTNVGDRLFQVPPGVSVRAHVQSIDLLPLASQVPSPSEQFNADMSVRTEQLNSAASSNIVHSTTPAEATSTQEIISSTLGSPVSSSTSETTTTEEIATTHETTIHTTTIAPTEKPEDAKDDDDDISIF